MSIQTGYIHATKGWPVVLSTGIGGDSGEWSVYLVKPNGNLQRCKSFNLHQTVEDAQKELENYKGKTLKKKVNI